MERRGDGVSIFIMLEWNLCKSKLLDEINLKVMTKAYVRKYFIN